jgi:hypothetical protein
MLNREDTILALDRFRLAATSLAVVVVVLGSFSAFGLGLILWETLQLSTGGFIGRPFWTFAFGVIGTIASSTLAVFIRGGAEALCSVCGALLGLTPRSADEQTVLADVAE